jgi:hypothetical protein
MMSLICLFLVPRLKSVGFFLWSFYFFLLHCVGLLIYLTESLRLQDDVHEFYLIYAIW